MLITNCRIIVTNQEKRLHDTKGIQRSGKVKGASTKLYKLLNTNSNKSVKLTCLSCLFNAGRSHSI